MQKYTNPVLTSPLQHRLAMVQDNLKRKLIDDQLGLIGMFVDCIRLRKRKTYEGDDKSLIVEMCDVIKAVFPPLEDVPFRKVQVDEKTHDWKLTSLIGAFEDDQQEKAYTLTIPYWFNINVNDIIFRIFIDEDIKFPIIIPIEIQELLGTFGGQKMIMMKAKGTIYTDNFPQEIVDTIKQMAVRRLRLGY